MLETFDTLEHMSPEQRARAKQIYNYKRNPNYCKNTPGKHKKDPMGCMPGYYETAPLRFDNRDQDYCDKCRRKLGLNAVFERRGGNRGTSEQKRKSLKEAQHRLKVRRGFVELNGLLNAKVDSGMTYGEIAKRCGPGYTMNSVRDWAVMSTWCPGDKVKRLAKVLGVSQRYLKTAKK